MLVLLQTRLQGIKFISLAFYLHNTVFAFHVVTNKYFLVLQSVFIKLGLMKIKLEKIYLHKFYADWRINRKIVKVKVKTLTTEWLKYEKDFIGGV